MFIGLRLDHGTVDIPAVKREMIDALPKSIGLQFDDGSAVVAKAERAIEPEAVALGVFGAIAASAGLLIAGQAIARQLRGNSEDLGVLRALGADSAMITSDGLIGVVGAVVVGSLVAVAVAVALSELAPIGPVRKVDPSPGIAADWTVLGAGLAVLIGGLGAAALAVAHWTAPYRGQRPRAVRGSTVVRAAAALGLLAPAVVGTRFALETGQGRATTPVRSAIVGVALAVVVVVTTLTFGSSLHTLVSRPALYGWNWDYALESGASIPPQTQTMLDHEPGVVAWSGVYFSTVELDGQPVAGIATNTGATVTAPILSGHAVDGSDQIVLGAATLAQLHKHLGDAVTARIGQSNPTNAVPPTSLRIVGTATMPTVGAADLVTRRWAPARSSRASCFPTKYGTRSATSPAPIRFWSVCTVATSPRHGDRYNKPLTQQIGSLPWIRTSPTTAMSWRCSRSNTRRRLSTTGQWARRPPSSPPGSRPARPSRWVSPSQHRYVADGGSWRCSRRSASRNDNSPRPLPGTRRSPPFSGSRWVPLGIALGRWLWILFARQINAVPHPTVPVASVILVAVGALVLANLVAALPGRRAAHTPTALLLRAE